MPALVIQESLPVHARSGVTVRGRYVVAAGRTKVFRVPGTSQPYGPQGPDPRILYLGQDSLATPA
jgi:hypothetical protein